jgi:hypothetical protein
MQEIFPCPEYLVLIRNTAGSVQNISHVENIGLALWERHVFVSVFPPR